MPNIVPVRGSQKIIISVKKSISVLLGKTKLTNDVTVPVTPTIDPRASNHVKLVNSVTVTTVSVKKTKYICKQQIGRKKA